MEKVSVIIPVYNSEKYIRQCLDSILNQTLPDFEILLIDDNSTDNSLNICIEYANRDSRITIYQQEHQGPGAARNAGIDRANGEYLLFLDSDDFFEPDMFARLYACASQTDAEVVFFEYDKFDDLTQQHIKIRKDKLKAFIPQETAFSPQAYYNVLFQFSGSEAWKHFFRTDYIRDYGFRFANTTCGEDIVLTMPARAMAKKMAYLPDVFVHYRVRTGTRLSNRKDLWRQLKKSYKLAWKELKKYKVHKLLKDSFKARKQVAKTWVKINLHEFH